LKQKVLNDSMISTIFWGSCQMLYYIFEW